MVHPQVREHRRAEADALDLLDVGAVLDPEDLVGALAEAADRSLSAREVIAQPPPVGPAAASRRSPPTSRVLVRRGCGGASCEASSCGSSSRSAARNPISGSRSKASRSVASQPGGALDDVVVQLDHVGSGRLAERARVAVVADVRLAAQDPDARIVERSRGTRPSRRWTRCPRSRSRGCRREVRRSTFSTHFWSSSTRLCVRTTIAMPPSAGTERPSTQPRSAGLARGPWPSG